MQAAKARGQHVGRPRKLTSHKLAYAQQLIEEGAKTRAGAAAAIGVNVSTLRRALRKTCYAPIAAPRGWSSS
jgi:DNA invertase Pin-like site-specific DNA recombinase